MTTFASASSSPSSTGRATSSPSGSQTNSPSLSFITARSRSTSPAASLYDSGGLASRQPSHETDTSLDSYCSEEDALDAHDTSDEEAQFARPMMDPWAEVEGGWRRMQQTQTNNNSLFARRRSSNRLETLSISATRVMPERELVIIPPHSSIPSKTSFAAEEFSMPSSTVEGTPVNNTFKEAPSSKPSTSPSLFINPPSPSLTYFNPPFPLPLPLAEHRIQDKALAPAPVHQSLSGNVPGGLKARRGSNKPLSLKVPTVTASDPAHNLASPLTVVDDRFDVSETRSLPPSPRVIDSEKMGVKKDVLLGMKTNVTGGLSMKRRTSIPRLSLAGNGATGRLVDMQMSRLSVSREEEDPSFNRGSAMAPLRLLGRNTERAMATPLKFSFDPIALEGGRRELLSSQVGVGGKGHIEMPEEVDGEVPEEFPYERGPREVLPGLYLGSEPNARDPDLLREMGFGYILNVAKEVDCPWLNEPAEEDVSEVQDKLSPLGRRCSMRVQATTTSPLSPLSGQDTTPSLSKYPPFAGTPHKSDSNSSLAGAGSLGSSLRALLIRPTASTPNLKTCFQNGITNCTDSSSLSPLDSSLNTASTTSTRRRSSRNMAMPKSDGAIDRTFAANPKTGRPQLRYRKLPWSHDQDGLPQEFIGAFDMIDEARSRGSNVLVHCQCGVSRSATLVIGYVMHAAAKGLEKGTVLNGIHGMHDAYSFVKEKSPWAGPNMGLIYQLIEYEKILSGKEDDDDDLQRLDHEVLSSTRSEQPSPSRSDTSPESAPDSTPHTPDTREVTRVVTISTTSPVDQAWDALHGIRRTFDAGHALGDLLNDVHHREEGLGVTHEELPQLPLFMKRSLSNSSTSPSSPSSTSTLNPNECLLPITTTSLSPSNKVSKRNSSIQILSTLPSQGLFPVNTPTAPAFAYKADSISPNSSTSTAPTTTTPISITTTSLVTETTNLGFIKQETKNKIVNNLTSLPLSEVHSSIMMRASIGPGVQIETRHLPSPNIIMNNTNNNNNNSSNSINSNSISHRQSGRQVFGRGCQTAMERKAAHRRAFSMDVSATFWKPNSLCSVARQSSIGVLGTSIATDEAVGGDDNDDVRREGEVKVDGAGDLKNGEDVGSNTMRTLNAPLV